MTKTVTVRKVPSLVIGNFLASTAPHRLPDQVSLEQEDGQADSYINLTIQQARALRDWLGSALADEPAAAMTNLVDELRALTANPSRREAPAGARQLCGAAADEIERLRAALKTVYTYEGYAMESTAEFLSADDLSAWLAHIRILAMDALQGRQSEPRDEPEFAKADASTATFQEAYDRQVKSEAKQYVYFAAEPSLIVSAEEAKQPLAFRHWTKDAGVPYAGCHCDTCISVSRAEPRGEFVRFPDPPYEFRGDSGKIECPLCHGDGSVYPLEHTKP